MLCCRGHFLLIIILCRLKCASWASWLCVDAAVKCCRGLHSQFLATLCNFVQIMLHPLSLVTTTVTLHVSRLVRPGPCPGFSGGGSWFLSRGRLERHEYKSEKSTLWQTCGRLLTRRETCGMWFESQMKRSNWIFLGLNLREEGRKFGIGTLWAAVLSSRNNHRLARFRTRPRSRTCLSSAIALSQAYWSF